MDYSRIQPSTEEMNKKQGIKIERLLQASRVSCKQAGCCARKMTLRDSLDLPAKGPFQNAHTAVKVSPVITNQSLRKIYEDPVSCQRFAASVD